MLRASFQVVWSSSFGDFVEAEVALGVCDTVHL